MEAITVNHVTQRFGPKEVLTDITLSVNSSEIFGLLGPSGSGKTTLVKLIAGIDEAVIGQVHILDQTMPNLGMMKEIGYMAQSDALYSELTAKQNLEFFAGLFGIKGPLLKQRINEVMELVNLTEHLNKTISRYSGGMKRRLSLAIALLHRPKILLLDEPTVGIDPVLRKSIWNELEKLSREGTTIVVTTHVMDEADKCYRLGMIRDGHLIAVDTPEALKAQTGSQTIEEAFLFYGGAKA